MVTEAIEKVQIVVDDRERPSGVVAELEKLDGLVLKIEHLNVGDYCIDGALGSQPNQRTVLFDRDSRRQYYEYDFAAQMKHRGDV